VQIGVSGEARVRITNAIKFNSEIVKDKDILLPMDVKDWIFSDIIAIIRDRISKMKAPDITSESLSIAVQAKGEKELPKYGLKIVKINVMYTALPEEWLDARREIGISEAEAQATRTRGAAKADALRARMDVLKDGMRASKETDSGLEVDDRGFKISRGSKDSPNFCPHCGFKVDTDEAKYCQACGKKL
jgi:membrane protease subunit (stomatin/prohibitin family)